jgi:2'-5' RNA ligase
VRVFAALPLPAAAAGALVEAIEPMRRETTGLRWVQPSAFHLTLHFFGEIDERAVSAIGAVLADPRLQRPAIPAGFGTLAHFPPRGPVRVLHAALDRGSAEAAAFHDALHVLLGPLGWAPDPRGFSPHITLARAGSRAVDTAPGEARTRLPALEFLLEECVLYQSVLGPGGARYSRLAALAFDKAGEGSP